MGCLGQKYLTQGYSQNGCLVQGCLERFLVDGALLDYVLQADNITDTQLAFGFSCLNQSYTGNTVQLKRLSDNVVSDFGFLASGIFDLASVNTWRAGADVNVVKFYDQNGTAKELVAGGNPTPSVQFIVDDVPFRFGTDFNATTGQLARSTVNGEFGCNLNGGWFRLDNSGIDVTSGLEMIMLSSTNTRKGNPASTYDYVDGSNDEKEVYCSYAIKELEQVELYCNSSYLIRRINSTNGGETQTNATQNGVQNLFLKQNSQQVNCLAISATSMDLYSLGCKLLHADVSGINLANNGSLLVGSDIWFTDNGTGSNWADSGNFVFGGIIVTKSLTDLQRFNTMSRLNALGQFHNYLSSADLLKMFDEVILFKDNADNAVTGKNAKTALTFNTAELLGSTPNWDFDYTVPGIGLSGVRTTVDNNYANAFKANNSYFAGVTSGTVLAVGIRETSGFNQWFGQGTGDYADTRAGEQGLCTNHSLSLGYDHDAIGLYSQAADDRVVGLAKEPFIGRPPYYGFGQFVEATVTSFNHTNNLVELVWNGLSDGDEVMFTNEGGALPTGLSASTVYYAINTSVYDFKVSLTQGGSAVDFTSNGSGTTKIQHFIKDVHNQSMGKYDIGLTNNYFDTTYTLKVDGEAFNTAKVWDLSDFEENANVSKPTPDNQPFPIGYNSLIYQIATFEAPAEYSREDSATVREPLMMKSKNYHYGATFNAPVGHIDGSVARSLKTDGTGFGSIVDSSEDAKIMSSNRLNALVGTRLALGFIKRALSFNEVEKLAVNLYKIL